MMYADRRLIGPALVLSVLFFAAGCAAKRADMPYVRSKAVEASSAGTGAFMRGDYIRALEGFKEALRISRSIDDRREEAVALVNIGRVLISLGHYGSAAARLTEASSLAYVLKGEDRLLAETLSTLAKARYLSGREGEALEDIEKADAIDRRAGVLSGERLNLKALIYARTGRKEEAGKLLKEALTANLRDSEDVEAANSYRALAELSFSDNDYATAMGLYLKAYELDSKNADSRKTALDLERMADIHMSEKRLHEAAFLFERSYIVSLNAGERARAAESLDKLIGAYNGMGDSEKAELYTRIKESITADIDKGRDMSR